MTFPFVQQNCAELNYLIVFHNLVNKKNILNNKFELKFKNVMNRDVIIINAISKNSTEYLYIIDIFHSLNHF